MTERGSGLSGLAHSESGEEIIERYDSWVSDYEHDVRSWGYTLPERIVERLRVAGDVTGAGRVLDAGCGTGLVGRALRGAGCVDDLVGVDVSQSSLRSAADRSTYSSLIAASITGGLPFGRASFDALVCGGVLTYVPDTEAALREFVRLLKPDGRAVISQRTDLWHERSCDDVVAALCADHIRVDVGEPEPYLPGLDEYGDDILVRLVVVQPPA